MGVVPLTTTIRCIRHPPALSGRPLPAHLRCGCLCAAQAPGPGCWLAGEGSSGAAAGSTPPACRHATLCSLGKSENVSIPGELVFIGWKRKKSNETSPLSSNAEHATGETIQFELQAFLLGNPTVSLAWGTRPESCWEAQRPGMPLCADGQDICRWDTPLLSCTTQGCRGSCLGEASTAVRKG